MFSTTAEIALRMYDEGNPLLSMLLQATQEMYTLRDKRPTSEQYAQFASLMSEVLDQPITSEQAKSLLDFYPATRTQLACGDIGDTDVDQHLRNAISHFFLCCQWPCYKDCIDIDKFCTVLREQARTFRL